MLRRMRCARQEAHQLLQSLRVGRVGGGVSRVGAGAAVQLESGLSLFQLIIT